MSTEKNIKTAQNRFALLARQGDTLFHTRDLAALWGITNLNTLYTTLKRYVGQGLLFRMYKGFYALKTLDELARTRLA